MTRVSTTRANYVMARAEWGQAICLPINRKFVVPAVVLVAVSTGAFGASSVSATANPVAAVSVQPPAPAPTPARLVSPVVKLATVTVHDGAGLSAALASAAPGTTIKLANGLYKARKQFTATTACTVAAPCRLQGGRGAVIDGTGMGGHYGLHLTDASNWTLLGFTVTNATKGIVLDRSSLNVIDGVDVHKIGAEGIHLRTMSSDNVVRASIVHDTGKKSPQYGEGIYIGSAVSNWGTYSGSKPDTSNRNVVTGNSVWATGAESVDIKEGTTGGALSNNTFDGAGMAGKNSADSWVDVKGNSWVISGNTGTNALLDGFQTHVAAPGWGQNNQFSGNTAHVNSTGYGFRFDKATTTRNVLRCDNAVTAAGLGLANQPCT